MILSAKLNSVDSNSVSRSSKALLFYQACKSKDVVYGLTVSANNFVPVAKGEAPIAAAFMRGEGQRVGCVKSEAGASIVLSSPSR